ncbi:MAG: class I SAM-dependent methyltransferase [Candidatus Heimdallarchaeota archaeon]
MNKKKLVREGYNNIAEEYLAERLEVVEDKSFFDEFTSLIKENDKVLDAGCGAGLPTSKDLSERFQVIGIDISDKQIELAKKNVPKGEFHRKDMTELDFPDNYFGGILAYYSIIHVPRDEHEDLFRNFFRMLKPTGVALFSLTSTDDSSYTNEDFFGKEMFWSGFDAETNIALLESIGYHIIWSKLVRDNLGSEGIHMFVMLQKPK